MVGGVEVREKLICVDCGNEIKEWEKVYNEIDLEGYFCPECTRRLKHLEFVEIERPELPELENAIDFVVGDHFLPGLVNADISGLDDEEIQQLREFEGKCAVLGSGHFDVGGQEDFAWCDVSGMMATCHRVGYVVREVAE
jgi:DNA-directed RNA polymerase subunit RPC12/RpoP